MAHTSYKQLMCWVSLPSFPKEKLKVFSAKQRPELMESVITKLPNSQAHSTPPTLPSHRFFEEKCRFKLIKPIVPQYKKKLLI